MFNVRQNLRSQVVLALTATLMIDAAQAQQFAAAPQGPLARLVKTPEDDAGRPPTYSLCIV